MNHDLNYQGEPFPNTHKIFERFTKIGEAFKMGLNDPLKYILLRELFTREKRGSRVLYKFDTVIYKNCLVRIQGVNTYADSSMGLYLLGNPVKGLFEPVYIGISRSISERLKGHLFRTDKGTSTFAWKMVLEDNKGQEIIGTPSELIKHKQQTYFKDLNLQVCPLENNFELHMAEVFLAAHLKTYWNSFKTT